nr:unnamed protein product [Digitaria exilis]
MAVHAQYAFPHDPRAITRPAALDNAKMSASAMFLGEPGVGAHHPLLAAAVGGGNAAFSDLTCINTTDDDTARLAPRKRARVGDVAGSPPGLIADPDLQGHRALLPPVPFAAAEDVQARLLCSGAAASTSGRPSQGVLSHLYRHGVETDALIRIETVPASKS